MLDGRPRARRASTASATLVDLRVGDLREPPVDERVPLVICPFRSLLHMPDEAEKLRALRAARALLEPGGRLVFDVFAPSREDIEETHGLWLEREPGIFERADWDEDDADAAALGALGRPAASIELHWLSAIEWRRLIDEAGFEVDGALRLVRPAAVRGRRGHDLGVPSAPRADRPLASGRLSPSSRESRA